MLAALTRSRIKPAMIARAGIAATGGCSCAVRLHQPRGAGAADLEARWMTNLPVNQRTELDICTLLDPRFKTYEFPGTSKNQPSHIKGVSEISTIFETALAHVRASGSRECCKDQCYHYID